MSIDYANTYGQVILDIKGSAAGKTYGKKEVYTIPASANRPFLRGWGRDLADFRANLLPSDHVIRSARYSEIGAKFKTLQLLDGPVDGKWPPDAIASALLGQNTTFTATGAGSTAAALEFKFQSAEELAVDDGNTVAQFRFSGDGFTKVTRGFCAVPDFYVNDWKQRGQNTSLAWFGVSSYTPGAPPAVVTKWWDNFEPFFSFLIATSRLIRKPGAGGVPLGTGPSADMKYALCQLEDVAFIGMGEDKAGRPSDSPVGRRVRRS